MTVDFWPTFQSQLKKGVPTRGEDCVVRSASMGISTVTNGKRTPTVKGFRQRAGKRTGGLNTAQLEKAVESYDTRSETAGFEPLKLRRIVDGSFDEVVTALREGEPVCAWINYEQVNARYPELSGDLNFKGTHCVMLLGKRMQDGSFETLEHDPLWDGRRRGKWKAPKGPQWVKVSILRELCAAVVNPDGTTLTKGFRGGIIKQVGAIAPK